MGQKTRPTGFRIGITEPHRSRWYASKKEFGSLLLEDHKIRTFIKEKYQFAGIPKIEIERTRDQSLKLIFDQLTSRTIERTRELLSTRLADHDQRRLITEALTKFRQQAS